MAAGKSRSPSSSRSISKSGDSPLSTSTSRAAPSRESWRQSSEPIDPPAPVTSTVLSIGSELCRQRSEEHTSELQSRRDLVCRLLLEKKKKKKKITNQ